MVSKILSTLVATIALSACVSAQDLSLEKQLSNELDEFAQSWAEGDIDDAMDLYLEDATYMSDAGPIAVDKLTERYQGMLQREYEGTRLRTENIEVRLLGEDVALMTAMYILESESGEMRGTGWFTLVWEETDDGWKVAHDHSS